MTSFKDKLSRGHYSVDYVLDTRIDDLTLLKDWIKRDEPRLTGWPPFVWIDRDEFRPRVVDQTTISCTIIAEEAISRPHYERWRASTDGVFTIVRAHDTDCFAEYEHAIGLTLPVWRIAELMLHAGRMAGRFSANTIEFTTRFTGLRGRSLIATRDSTRILSRNYRTEADDFIRSITLDTESVEAGVAAFTDQLLRPFYGLFEFSLPATLTEEEIKKMRANRF